MHTVCMCTVIKQSKAKEERRVPLVYIRINRVPMYIIYSYIILLLLLLNKGVSLLNRLGSF